MSRTTSCRPTSLYRLDGGYPLADYLSTPTSAEVRVARAVDLGQTVGYTRSGLLRSDRPDWLGHLGSLTGTTAELPSVHAFGVLLVPRGSWTYALTWGGGHHLLQDELVDHAFGLLFGVRRLDDRRLGLVASAALDATGRTTTTSYPGGAALPDFGLEVFGELVNRLAGRADLRGLTYGEETERPYRIRVGSGLHLPVPHDPAALIADLDAITEIVHESDEHSPLRFIAQTRPVPRHDPKLPELHHLLAAALGGDAGAGVLGLAWPADAVLDAEAGGSFRVARLGPGGPFTVDTDIELADLTTRFAEIPEDRRFDSLKAATMVACADPDGRTEAGSPMSLRKWVTFEAQLGDIRYCYHQGRWYRIGQGFTDRIRAQVRELLSHRSPLTFPLWTPTGKSDDEHRYCETVADQDGFLCLDRKLAKTPFHRQFELCDLLGPNDELIHVKWLGGATAASHLYTQAAVAAQSLRDEPEALTELNRKVGVLSPGRAVNRPSKVVLAIAGRGWNVDELFTLSQIGLLRLDRTLRGLGARLEFAEIPHVPKVRRVTARAA